MALKINRKLQIISLVLGWAIVLTLVILVIKLLVWEDNYCVTKTSEKRSEAIPTLLRIGVPLSITNNLPNIDEYRTSAGKPETISIPRLNLKARILESRISESGLLPVPSDINDTLWYSGSSLPGKGGTTIISGLSAGNGNPGVFAKLDSLEEGDEIEIKNGADEKIYVYVIKEISMIAAQDSSIILPKTQRKFEGKETLSLVTAIGESESEYQSIVMLRAVKKD